MKNKIVAAALLSAVLLCSCEENGGEAPQSGSTDSTENSVSSVVSSEKISEDTETSPADDLTGTDQEVLLEEIRDTLADFSEFSYMYLKCSAYLDEGFLDTQDAVSANGKEYYRAVGGDYTKYSPLIAEIDRYCLESVAEECHLKDFCIEGENDALYICKDSLSDIGITGLDIAYISSIEITADNFVILHMNAQGDGEFWEYPNGEDRVIGFDITMARYSGLWKLTECGADETDYLTWLFNPDYEG